MRAPRLPAALVVSCALGACGGEIIAIDLPRLERTASFVITTERDDVVVEAVALELGDTTHNGPRALVDVAPDEVVALTVVGLEETLDPLGLVAGASGPTAAEAAREVSTLRGRTAIFRTTVDATGRSPWVAAPELPRSVARVRLPASRGCRRFRIEPLPPLSDAAAFVQTVQGRTLVGTEDNHLIPIPPVGTSTDVTPVPPAGELRFPTWGAHPFDDDPNELWLSARDGKLWHVRFDAELHADVLDIIPTGQPHAMRWIAGVARRDRTHLVMMGLDGSVLTWDGVRFELIHSFPDLRIANWSGGIARADDGTILAGRNVGREVIVVRPDDRVERIVLGDGDVGVLDVENVPGLGVIVSDAHGRIFRWTGSGFTPLFDSEIRAGIEALVPIEGGFVAAGNFGTMREWRAQGGFCPTGDPLLLQSLRWWAPVDGGYVVSGPAPDGGRPHAVPLSRIVYD